MLQLIDTKKIANHYMSAIINNDYSGIDDNDKKMIDEFMKNYHNCSFCTDNIDMAHFDICDICKLYAEVYDVNIYQWRN